MDRISTFQTFIAKSPNDPFPRYGLAMEWKGRGDVDQAWREFEVLLANFPDYVPTYLMAGGTLAALGRHAEARAVYQTGIDVATRRGDAHARGELVSALAELPATG